jgi:hypothetical protein
MRGKFMPVTKTGGEWVKTGRKPSKTAGLITANSTQNRCRMPENRCRMPVESGLNGGLTGARLSMPHAA